MLMNCFASLFLAIIIPANNVESTLDFVGKVFLYCDLHDYSVVT